MSSNKIVRSTIDWIINYRWLVLVASVLIAFAIGSGARFLTLGTDYRIFFSDDNPDLLAFDAIEDIYTKNDSVLFLIQPGDGEVFSPKNLTTLRELTEEAWQIPHSIRVDSLTNFQHTWADGDELIVEDLIGKGEVTNELAVRAQQVTRNEPLLRGRLLSPDETITAVNVKIQLPGKSQEEVFEVSSKAREIRDRFEAKDPSLDIHLTGIAMLNNAFAETPLTDAPVVMPIMFTVFTLTMIFFLRSLKGAVITLLVVMLSAMVAVGTFGFLGFQLDPVSAAAPVIVLTLGVADSIHLLVTFFGRLRKGDSKDDAIRETFRVNASPVLLTSITTAIGFLSLNFSDAPPFQLLGNITAVGVLAAWAFSMTFLPAVLAIVPFRAPASDSFSLRLVDRLADFAIEYSRPLGIGLTMISLALCASIFTITVNDRYHEYFAKSLDFRQASDFALENDLSIYSASYSLESEGSQQVANPKFLQSVDRFTTWLRSQPEVQHVYSFSDTMKRLNKNLHGDDASYYTLPDSQQLGSQYLLLYEMSLPYGLDINDQINVDKSATRLNITYATSDLNKMEASAKKSDAWLAANTSGNLSKSKAASTGLMFAKITRRNIDSMLVGTLIGFLVISLVMGLSLKSTRMGVLSLVPNVLPSVMAFGVWAILVQEVGFAVSVVAGLSIGIIVDDTVHFLSKYRRARVELGYSPEQAIRYSFHTVGTALLGTTVIVGFGFVMLGFSTFRTTAYMGYLTSLAIVCALVCDFFLLPALLLYFDTETTVEVTTEEPLSEDPDATALETA